MSDDTMKKIADGLQAAMRAEHEGHHFYLMAAATTKDPKGREVFEQLAREELEHVEFLQKQYTSLLETGKPDASLKLGSGTDLGGSSPIFSESLRDRLGDAHFEMTALAVGLQLELGGKNFYERQALEASDPVIATFYKELADWEAGHYNALLAQQDSLKEDYWSVSGFAPF